MDLVKQRDFVAWVRERNPVTVVKQGLPRTCEKADRPQGTAGGCATSAAGAHHNTQRREVTIQTFKRGFTQVRSPFFSLLFYSSTTVKLNLSYTYSARRK